MRLALALGVAFTAMTAAAFAQQSDRIFIRHHGGPHAEIDANNDGWVSRAEASAGADRVFADLDSNDDGRLTETDHPQIEEFNIRVPEPGEPAEDGENCTRTVDPPNAREGEERRVTVICNSESSGRRVLRHHGDAGEHHERTVTIVRSGHGEGHAEADAAAPVPPVPPLPPHPPMFIMMYGNSEADLNGDGAMSQDEFRAQHLRYFDAADANGDGRVRFERPPAPPEPPSAPTPPEPPRRR